MCGTRVLPRGFSRRNINKIVSKITSVSEANIGFLSSVSIVNLRQGLFEHLFQTSTQRGLDVAMKVRMIQLIRISAAVVFRANVVVKTRQTCRTRDPTVLKTIHETFQSVAIWRYKE